MATFMPKSSPVTYPCPHCGERVLTTARVCRCCGFSDEYDELDDGHDINGEDDFDYDEFVSREFPDHADPESLVSKKQFFVRVVILAIIASFLLTLFF